MNEETAGVIRQLHVFPLLNIFDETTNAPKYFSLKLRFFKN